MSINQVSNAAFDFAMLALRSTSSQSVSSGTDRLGSSSALGFSASLAQRVADLRAQIMLDSLTASTVGRDQARRPTNFSDLLASLHPSAKPLPSPTPVSQASTLSPTGRNTALFDPESAYRMMSVINNRDVAYKAQFSELSRMKSRVAEIRLDGQRLGDISASTSNDSIKSQLLEFAERYNDWIRSFDAAMEDGGILATTQAAQVSRYELEQSVSNIFVGAKDGLHGLRDLGLTIDPETKLAAVDTTRLDSLLASNKQGVINAVQEFSVNFVKSADLLNAGGNFISNRLNNLGRVIHYIDDHKASLQAEFGLGDPAQPSSLVAQALAAYNAVYGT